MVSDEGPLQHRACSRKELFFWNSENGVFCAVLIYASVVA